MFTSPSQVLCTVLGVHIYFYGVILAIAIAVAALVADWVGTKYFELKKEAVIDMTPYLIVFGIIGARLYYCLMDFGFYMRFPTEILAIRHGGISIHGAIFGGLAGLIIYALRHKLSIKRLCDVSAIGLALGQAIGRWGNFFNSEAYGLPTNLPWKLYIAPQYRQVPYLNIDYYHPAFLYESILDFIIFVILIFIARSKKTKKEGNIALIYLILYSVARILVEYIRIDSIRYLFGVSVAIIMSAGIIILSTILLILNNRNKEKEIDK
jgi:phosphatidylglycerol:prolipoprotein diacylglycerol transferase